MITILKFKQAIEFQATLPENAIDVLDEMGRQKPILSAYLVPAESQGDAPKIYTLDLVPTFDKKFKEVEGFVDFVRDYLAELAKSIAKIKPDFLLVNQVAIKVTGGGRKFNPVEHFGMLPDFMTNLRNATGLSYRRAIPKPFEKFLYLFNPQSIPKAQDSIRQGRLAVPAALRELTGIGSFTEGITGVERLFILMKPVDKKFSVNRLFEESLNDKITDNYRINSKSLQDSAIKIRRSNDLTELKNVLIEAVMDIEFMSSFGQSTSSEKLIPADECRQQVAKFKSTVAGGRSTCKNILMNDLGITEEQFDLLMEIPSVEDTEYQIVDGQRQQPKRKQALEQAFGEGGISILASDLKQKIRSHLLENPIFTEKQAKELAEEIKLKVEKDGMVEITPAALEKEQERIDKTVTEFNQITSGIGLGNLRSIVMSSGRAHASPNTKTVKISFTSGDATLFHELGHFLEFSNPELFQQAQLFLLEHATGTTLKTMNSLTGLNLYRADEKGLEGYYHSPYIGKVYEGAGSSEVISMLIELLTDDAREDFSEILEKYPHEIVFIVGLLESLRTPKRA